MRVTVENFQSLGHAQITVAGLTVLVGPSNRGKSALIRALEAVLFNKPGEEFVRHGKKKARVEILDAPGLPHQVTWVKGGGKTAYTLGTDVFSKVGQGTPPALTAAGYRDVWIGDKDRKKGEWLRPQVSEQGPGTYFLLDRPGSFVSDVLGAISRHAVLLTAQGRAAGDTRTTKHQLGTRQTDLTTARAQRDALQGVPAFAARVEGLVALEAARVALAATVTRLRSLVAWRAVYRDFVRSATLPHVTQMPALDDQLRLVTRGAALLALRPLRLTLGGSEVPARVDIPELPNVAKARGLTGYRGKLAPLAGRAFPAASVDVHLPSADVWAVETQKVAGVVDRRLKALDMLYRCETAVKVTKGEAEETKKALAALLASLDVCPTCERPM